MGNIVLLDELTINKIAAGEVIERPASVVKELMENSIDAGATSITVEVQNGGISKIRITDNGKGIEPDDMRIAFERHATSKIRVADDLNIVRTMGFRGEALASIAAIARVELVSRTKNSDMGNRIIVEGGKILKEEPTGAPIGTTITVENLFFNTPVRYKFLKKDYTEAGYIEDAVTRLALVNLDISMKLISAGKTVLFTQGNGDMKSVVYNIYGKDVAEGILNVNYEFDGVKVRGAVGKPEIARSNRMYQQFFVNSRYVKDKVLSAAVDQAFKGMIPIGKYGFTILNVQVSPEKIDVNVHPAKLEIRFQDENKIFKAVMYAVKETLLQRQLINTVSKPGIEFTPNTTRITMKADDVFKPKNVMPEHKENTEQKKNKTIADLFKKITSGDENEKKEIYNNRYNEVAENIENNVPIQNNEIPVTEVIPQNVNSNNEMIINNVIEEPTVKPKRMLEDIGVVTEPKIGKRMQEDVIVQNEPRNLTNEVVNNANVNETSTNIQVDNFGSSNVEEKVEIIVNKLNEFKEESNSYLDDSMEYKKVNFDEMYEKTFGDVPSSLKPKEETFKEIKYADNVSFFEQNKKYANYKYIGSAFSTFIIIEIEDELYIIDQHAAHERIMYEKVKKNFYSDSEKNSQLLLVPDVINLSHKDMLIAEENFEIFRKAGFMVDEFGENTVKLSGVPDMCIDLDTKSLFIDILDEIDTVARTEKQEKEEKFIATVACKSAVKANNALTEPEVRALIDRLLQLPNPFTCPHGRPTAIKLTKIDFEKKFNRR